MLMKFSVIELIHIIYRGNLPSKTPVHAKPTIRIIIIRMITALAINLARKAFEIAILFCS